MHAFDILGDPVRRRILELLASGEHASGEVVAVVGAEFGITQSAVSQHLKVLREAGFATARVDGQRRVYVLEREAVSEAEAWLEGLRAFWTPKFEALATEVVRGKKRRASLPLVGREGGEAARVGESDLLPHPDRFAIVPPQVGEGRGLADLRTGGKRAIAAALATLEAYPEDAGIQALLDEAWRAQQGIALGLTGPPGVGKSTLANALVKALRARGATVAVAAVDPSSRASGGAILGDRARIDADPADQGVFVRSFAARDRLGGLADLAAPASVLFRSLYDWTLIETVGVGQSETEIADIADLVLFCAQPASGDALQFMKAGVMEIPDIAVVTKADMGTPARRAAADLKASLALAVREGDPPRVLTCSASTGEGIETLIEALVALADRLAGPSLAARRRAQGEAFVAQSLKARFGREGYAALGDLARFGGDETPFARERAAIAAMRARGAGKA